LIGLDRSKVYPRKSGTGESKNTKIKQTQRLLTLPNRFAPLTALWAKCGKCARWRYEKSKPPQRTTSNRRI